MNANLKEYIRLCSTPAVQEKIREGMGEWRIGDMCVVLDEFALVYGIIQATSRQGRRIYIRFLDRKEDYKSGVVNPPEVIAQDFDEDANKYYLRLPQVHDLRDEKRGLWGMVDWELWHVHTTIDGRIIMEGKGPEIIATPELAPLKALMRQWGIEE